MMKKIVAILIIGALSMSAAYSQYFQGTFTNSGNTLVFKMKPTANLTTQISYLEFCFRYVTATTPVFTIGNLVNGADFPGITLQRRSDYVSGAYTYVRYVHNTSIIANFSYLSGVEYEIGRLNLLGAGIGNFEMASDLIEPNNETVFGVVNGSGNLIDPGAGNQLYGPGFNIAGDVHLLPLANVPIPVKFTGFTAVKKDDNGLLNWKVENENAETDYYEVERSLNGRDFIKVTNVAKTAAQGNGSNIYSFTDYNLKALRADVIYYRIKQVDKDGKFAYTEIKSIRLDGKAFSVNIFPNPVLVIGNVNIDLVENGKVNIFLTDATGKEITKTFIEGKSGLNVYKLNMNNLAAGTYQLKVTSGNETKVIPVVKNK